MAFEDVEAAAPQFWNPEEIGEDIEGNVYQIREGSYGPQIVLDMGDDEDGNMITTTLPSHRQLQSFIPKLKVGDYIRVEFVKLVEPTVEGRSATRIYKVQKDPERAISYDE